MDDIGDLRLTPELLEELRRPKLNLTAFGPCLCGTLLKVEDHTRRWHSGGVNYNELLCDDCRSTYKGLPRIVCLGCRSLMGFTPPGKQSTGFVFRKNFHYHIADCPQCNSDARATPVLEHERYCAEMGIPTKTNQDLLQEIEQKILKGKLESARLASEFKSSDTDES